MPHAQLQSTALPRCFLLLLWLNCLANSGLEAAVDPWTGVFREFALTTKETVQKFFVQLGLVQQPASTAGGSGLGFQLDPSSSPLPPPMPPPCPFCRQLPVQTLTGRWQLSLMSRYFRLNALSELDTLIARTRAGLPFSERRTLQDLVQDPPDPICPTMTVLELSADSSKWELAYRLPDGRFNSVIGLLEQLPFDGSLLWRVGSLRMAQFCLALASYKLTANADSQPPSNGTSSAQNGTFPVPPTLPIAPSPSAEPQAFVVLAQVDGWPRCENFVALTRGMDNEGVAQLRELLERQPVVGDAMSRLERTKC